MVRLVAISLAAVLVLLVGAAVTLWLLFDPNDYRGYLSDQVKAQTGRDFFIEDDLELTFFPWLGVQMGGIRLSNAAGYGEEDFARIRQATVRVRLLPLLRRRVEIGTIVLDGLELSLARNAENRGNWEDLFTGTEPSPEATTGPTPTFRELDIAGIDIRDGLIFWRENIDDVRYVLSELSLELGAIAPGRPVQATIGFQLVGQVAAHHVEGGLAQAIGIGATAGVVGDGSHERGHVDNSR